jgi:hypothetical protein
MDSFEVKSSKRIFHGYFPLPFLRLISAELCFYGPLPVCLGIHFLGPTVTLLSHCDFPKGNVLLSIALKLNYK